MKNQQTNENGGFNPNFMLSGKKTSFVIYFYIIERMIYTKKDVVYPEGMKFISAINQIAAV